MASKPAKNDSKELMGLDLLVPLYSYQKEYCFKVQFIEFLMKKIVYTGRMEDLVLREDFRRACNGYCGIWRPRCWEDNETHLRSIGVRMLRTWSPEGVRKNYFVGIRLLDGETQLFDKDVENGGKSDDDTKRTTPAGTPGENQRAPSGSRPTAATTVKRV